MKSRASRAYDHWWAQLLPLLVAAVAVLAAAAVVID